MNPKQSTKAIFKKEQNFMSVEPTAEAISKVKVKLELKLRINSTERRDVFPL